MWKFNWFLLGYILAVPERKSKDSVLRIRYHSSAAYALGEKELNESTDLLCHFVVEILHGCRILLQKSESKSIKHIQTILRDYGIVSTSFVLHWIGVSQQPWVHAASDRSNEGNHGSNEQIGILAKHNTTSCTDTTCFSNMAQCFNGQGRVYPCPSVSMVFHYVL